MANFRYSIQWSRSPSCKNGPTIAEVLRDKLGREPTDAELCADVRRILSEASDARLIEAAMKGKLPHQRKK